MATIDTIQKAALAKQLGVDPPRVDMRTGREEERVRVRVECTSEGQASAGHLFNVGEKIVEVYVSQVAELKALEETYLLEPVVERVQRVKPSITVGEVGQLEPSIESLDVPVREEDQRGLEGEEREAAAAENRRGVERHHRQCLAEYQRAAAEGKNKYRRTYLPSVPASFREIMGRDLRPFSSVTIIDEKASPKEKRAA